MKYILGLLLIIGVGYGTYAYINSDVPELEAISTTKNYDGAWEIVMTPTSGAKCVEARVAGTVSGGELKSVMSTRDGVNSSFWIHVSPDGTISNRGSANLTSFKGLLYSGSGTGTWSDKYSCAGSFTMRREEASIDGNYLAPKQPSKGEAEELKQVRPME